MTDPLPENIRDYQDQIKALFDKIEPLIEEFRSIGMSGVFIMGSYDELTRVPHSQWKVFGNPMTVWGQVEEFREGQRAMMRGQFCIVEHGEEEDE